jgi:hypothetical protein
MQPLEVETDAMASRVQKQASQQWVWLAMDIKPHPIMINATVIDITISM